MVTKLEFVNWNFSLNQTQLDNIMSKHHELIQQDARVSCYSCQFVNCKQSTIVQYHTKPKNGGHYDNKNPFFYIFTFTQYF